MNFEITQPTVMQIETNEPSVAHAAMGSMHMQEYFDLFGAHWFVSDIKWGHDTPVGFSATITASTVRELRLGPMPTPLWMWQ